MDTNFFTSNSDDTWYNNSITRTAAAVAGTAVVLGAGYYGYKTLVSAAPAIANAAGSAASAAGSVATTAAEAAHALVATL